MGSTSFSESTSATTLRPLSLGWGGAVVESLVGVFPEMGILFIVRLFLQSRPEGQPPVRQACVLIIILILCMCRTCPVFFLDAPILI